MRENEDAARIFMKVRQQTINIWNGERDIPVDLNHLVVWSWIDAYKIRDRIGTFEKIIYAWHEIRKNEDD